MENRNLLISCLTVLSLLFLSSYAYALPEGQQVVSGNAEFSQPDATTLNINTSDRVIINYQSFSIAQPETVQFVQPSSSSIALNRVVGIDPSSILGTLSANGRIFLTNPNGILFGPNSRVDAAGLVASTLNISNDDFLNGRFNFQGQGGYILNQGNLVAKPGGYVCLMAGAVENQGLVQADLGTAVLASGEKLTLNLDDAGSISVVIDEGVGAEIFGPDGEKIDSAIKNSGKVQANGGKVILTAKVLNNVFDYAINNSGILEAKSLAEKDGEVILAAEGAPIINTGKIEAGKVTVEIEDSDFINEGEVITDGSAQIPDAGNIYIEAINILQSGLISANAYNKGSAGEIAIISVLSTVLDENSATSAACPFAIGNGGRIYINSLRGNTSVLHNASIDVSAGSIQGDAGFIEVSAHAQLGFYGILSGRAPPGYQGATVLFDPTNIVIATGGGDSLTNPGTPQEGYTDHLGLDVTFDPATLEGLAVALIWLQAINDITLDSVLSLTDQSIILEAGNNININANLIVSDGDITLIADAPTYRNNVGYVFLASTKVIETQTTGNIEISGAQVRLSDGVINSAENLIISGQPAQTDGTPSIQAAINVVGTVDGTCTINVAAGIYAEDIGIDKSLILQGAGADDVTLNGGIIVTASSVTVDGFTLTPTGHAVIIDSSGGVIDSITITNNIFEMPVSPRVGVWIGGSSPVGQVSNVAINDNTFNGPTNKISNPFKIGGQFGTPLSVEVDGVEFQRNTVNRGSIPINLQDSNLNDILIAENDFRNTDGVVYVWVQSATTPTGILSNFVFENNDVDSSNSYGVGIDVFGSIFTDANFGAGNEIFNNSFDGIPGAYGFGAVSILADLTDYVLDASGNWWGTNVASGVALEVSSDVDYTPWLDVGTDSNLGIGFAGDFSTLNIDDDSPQSGSTGRIQEAIDLVTGSTVNVAAGTYDETLNIVDRTNISIVGEDKNTTIIKSSTSLGWGHPPGGSDYAEARQTMIRVVGSTDIDFRNFTFDFSLMKTAVSGIDYVSGILYWTSTGTIDNNILKDIGMLDIPDDPTKKATLQEQTLYVRAQKFEGGLYSHTTRADVAITNNEFINTGRSGVVTHEYVDVTIYNNLFHKDAPYDGSGADYDLGCAIELGSESIGTVTDNIIYGYETGRDWSSAGIYIENAFTIGATPPFTKTVSVEGNEVYSSQIGASLGCTSTTSKGDVEIVVNFSDNNIHDNREAGVQIADANASEGSSVTVNARGNIITNNGDYGYYIYTKGDGDVTLNASEETITNHAYGVFIEDTGETSTSVYDVTIDTSNIFNNTTYGLLNDITTQITATKNYWGDATGPQHTTTNTSGLGNGVSDNVDYSPWWGENYLSGTAPNITLVAHPWIWYVNSSNNSTIQEGINAASSSDIINVLAGTYNLTSPIVVNKSVTLTGDIVTPNNVVVNTPTTEGLYDRDCFQVLANDVTIQGFKIVGAMDDREDHHPAWGQPGRQNAGIMVGSEATLTTQGVYRGISGGTFSYNEFVDCSKGLFLYHATNCEVSYNTITTTEGQDPDNFYDALGWNGDGIHVYLEVASDYPTGNTISHNTMNNVRVGIFLNGDSISGTDPSAWDFRGTTIEDNTMTNAWNAGIILQCASGTAELPIIIKDNNIGTTTGRRTGDEGNERGLISVHGDYVEVTGNTLTNCEEHGMWIDGSHYTFTGNTVTSNTKDGIHVGWYKQTEPNNGWTLPEIVRTDISISNNTLENNNIQVGDPTEALDMQSVFDNNTFDRAVTVDHEGASLLHTIWSSIQDGIDASLAADTVNVAAGTYTEQINIEKPLTIIGAGVDSTHIVSPDPTTMEIYDLFGSKGPDVRYLGHRGPNIPVVRIAASDVTFEGFHIDLADQVFWDVLGSFAYGPYSRSVGILVDHVETIPDIPDQFTGITIQNNKIDGLLWDDYGDCIKVLASATADINNNILYGYGESAISALGVSSPIRAAFYPTVTANDNTIYGGSGAREGNHYFFGVGYWSGATGSADGNTIYNAPNDNGYALNSWTPNPVSFTDNIILTDGGTVGGYGAQLYESSSLIFSGNNIQDQGLAGAIWKGGGTGITITITNNEIINCIDGFIGDGLTAGSVTLHYNNFEGTADGHYALDMAGHGVSIWGSADPCTIVADATKNYWGDTNPTDDISGNVDYSPWLGIGTDADPDTLGFQPVSPMTWYTNDSIQDAIDVASNTVQDTINVLAGTYAGDVDINKDLTLELFDGDATVTGNFGQDKTLTLNQNTYILNVDGTFTNSGTINSSADIHIISSGDFSVGTISSSGDVNLESSSGSILDNDLGTIGGGDEDIIGNNVDLWALGDIGKAGAEEEIDLQYSGTFTENKAPLAPTYFIPSHTIGTFSDDNTIDIVWAIAKDLGYPGSGIAGYAYVWDSSAGTAINETSTVVASSFTTSPALANGQSHYFHIRTKDNSGNWSTTTPLGPFFIDTTINAVLSSDILPLAALTNVPVLIGQYTISSFNPTPTFYFYHPLTPVDSSAFDDIVLTEDAYEFIEGVLKFKKSLPVYYQPTL